LLDERIVKKLSRVLKGKKTVGTIKKDISLLRHEFPASTPNARAQVYAIRNRTSVWQYLSDDDRKSLPANVAQVTQHCTVSRKGARRKEKILHFVRYPTSNPFRLAHIDEANRTYTYSCYTSTFIICRKIIENIVADILRAKFPANKRENKELYYDTIRGRTRDFKELLASLKSKKADFEMDKRLVERLLSAIEPFKEEADRKTHSWYYIVRSKSEIDRLDMQNIFDLLYELEQKAS
jgi:hypothetical protein